MHLKELPYYQARAWQHLDEEIKAQRPITKYRREWSDIDKVSDNGFFGTTSFFISFTDNSKQLRRAQHCYLNALIVDLMGEESKAQALITENLFRLWFSNPNMEAIIWWNLSDGAAFENEDEFKGALLRSDMSEKPVYEMLERLINKEWHTEETVNASEDGSFNFRGFYGEYEISAETDKGQFQINKKF